MNSQSIDWPHYEQQHEVLRYSCPTLCIAAWWYRVVRWYSTIQDILVLLLYYVQYSVPCKLYQELVLCLSPPILLSSPLFSFSPPINIIYLVLTCVMYTRINSRNSDPESHTTTWYYIDRPGSRFSPTIRLLSMILHLVHCRYAYLHQVATRKTIGRVVYHAQGYAAVTNSSLLVCARNSNCWVVLSLLLQNYDACCCWSAGGLLLVRCT